MRILKESICWTDWVQCFDEWTLIYIILLNIMCLCLMFIVITLINQIKNINQKAKGDTNGNK